MGQRGERSPILLHGHAEQGNGVRNQRVAPEAGQEARIQVRSWSRFRLTGSDDFVFPFKIPPTKSQHDYSMKLAGFEHWLECYLLRGKGIGCMWPIANEFVENFDK